MVEWSAGLITRYVKGQSVRTANREARGHDAHAPIAEFGQKIMYMTSKNTSKSAPKADAKFQDGIWLGLRTRSDESIIGTPNGVIKAKTVRRLPEERRWYPEDVFSVRGVPSNSVLGVEITSLLKSADQDMPNVDKMSTRHHKSGRSMTLSQQLQYRTRQ